MQQHRVLRPVDDPRYVTVDLDFAMAFAVLSLIRAAIRAELIESPEWLPVTALSFATPLALIVSIVVWMNLTKGVVEGHGGRVTVLRNWALSWGSLILFLSYLLPAKTPTAFHVARAGAATLLVAGLLISRTKLHRWLAEPAPAADMASHTHLPQERVPQRLRSGPPPGTPIARLLPPAVEVPSRDWDASSWDPEIQADIERRRRRGEPPR
ncbi:hypothetical protein Afe04nite_33370 [Asanoa ferruginea]|nr:hypothetical protein Afe04nite_33370 [Asanoa ferruginea]